MPLGALARLRGDTLTLAGLVADPDGRRFYLDSLTSPASEAFRTGVRLAEDLLARGGAEVLAEVYADA